MNIQCFEVQMHNAFQNRPKIRAPIDFLSFVQVALGARSENLQKKRAPNIRKQYCFRTFGVGFWTSFLSAPKARPATSSQHCLDQIYHRFVPHYAFEPQNTEYSKKTEYSKHWIFETLNMCDAMKTLNIQWKHWIFPEKASPRNVPETHG